MNSDKAADVRDSVNAVPCVAYGIEPRDYGGTDRFTTHKGGYEVTITGPHVPLKDYRFAPARIEEAAEIAFSEDPDRRPCFEVVLPAINLPGDCHAYIPRDVVYEAAKHDCLVRCGSDGTLRLRDDWQHREEPDTDGDRCPDCGCTRYRLRDGVPECERCGATAESAVEESSHELTIADFAGGDGS